MAAKNTNRNSIGYEINTEFIPVIKEKLKVHQTDLDGTTYEFLKQKNLTIDFNKEINKLPYIFKDPHILDKKIDIKKLQFGSKIDNSIIIKKEQFFIVKEIISPEKILLNNNIIVKLLGIKEDPLANGEATSYLVDKTKGKRVFLKYDEIKYDCENNLLCYLFLENKTFINAHLIKNKLVKVDKDLDFKYKKKFLKLFLQHHA